MESELFADLTVTISRVAAPSTAAVSPVPAPSIIADNWGGLFDGGDDSVEQQYEACIVADNWGGLFEQHAHDPEERDLGLSIVVFGSAQICNEHGPGVVHKPVPVLDATSTDSDVAYGSELSSTDGEAISNHTSEEPSGATECDYNVADGADIVFGALTSTGPDMPLDVGQEFVQCGPLDTAFSDSAPDATSTTILVQIKPEQSVPEEYPHQIHVETVLPSIGNEVVDTNQVPQKEAERSGHLGGALLLLCARDEVQICVDAVAVEREKVQIDNIATIEETISPPPAVPAGPLRLSQPRLAHPAPPAWRFRPRRAPLLRCPRRARPRLRRFRRLWRAPPRLPRLRRSQRAPPRPPWLLRPRRAFPRLLRRRRRRRTAGVEACHPLQPTQHGLVVRPRRMRLPRQLFRAITTGPTREAAMASSISTPRNASSMVLATALSKSSAHSIHAARVFDEMWNKSVPMKPGSRDGAVCRDFGHFLLSVCSYRLHQSCIITWLRRSTPSCIIELQPWSPPVESEQVVGFQIRCVLIDLVVPWEYMMILVLGAMEMCDGLVMRPRPWRPFWYFAVEFGSCNAISGLHSIRSYCIFGGLVQPIRLLHLLSQWTSNFLSVQSSHMQRWIDSSMLRFGIILMFIAAQACVFLHEGKFSEPTHITMSIWIAGDQTYIEKPGHDFSLTTSSESVEALNYGALAIPNGSKFLLSVSNYLLSVQQKCGGNCQCLLFEVPGQKSRVARGKADGAHLAVAEILLVPSIIVPGYFLHLSGWVVTQYKPPWWPPQRNMTWFQLSVSFVIHWSLCQSTVPLFPCVSCQEYWKLWRKLHQIAVQVAELNDIKLSCTWLSVYMIQLFPGKLQALTIIFLHLINDKRAMLLLGVGQWGMILSLAYMFKREFLYKDICENSECLVLDGVTLHFEIKGGASLVKFELLTTGIARGGFVPPSVPAWFELPVVYYIGSCCFYDGWVAPFWLLQLLSQWVSTSLLFLRWATAGLFMIRLDWFPCSIELQPWPPPTTLQTNTSSELVETISVGSKLNALDHVTLASSDLIELGYDELQSGPCKKHVSYIDPKTYSLDWKIQQGVSDNLVWCLGRLLFSITDLQMPWDPGGTEILHRLGGKPNLKERGMSAVSYGWAVQYYAMGRTCTSLEAHDANTRKEYKGRKATGVGYESIKQLS